MEWTIRELRSFVTAAESGSLTAAAADMHVSQASISRSIASLERTLGQRLLHRGRHGSEVTALGEVLLPQARRILVGIDHFNALASRQHERLVVGYAWAALGRHTTALLRGWAKDHPETELRLVQHSSPTSGLAEGLCDAAIMRTTPTDQRFASVVVGLERRFAAFSNDDPLWANRRTLRMRDFDGRTVLIDSRTGTTSNALWEGGPAPDHFVECRSMEEWLNLIDAGTGVGISSEASASQHARSGVVFRQIVDAPRIPVHLVWWRKDPPSGIGTLIETATRLYAG